MIAALPLVSSALSLLAPSGVAPSGAAPTAAPTGPGAASPGGDFGQVMAQVSSDAVQSLKSAESLSIDGLEGKANVQAVVQAVMSAQESLQTAVAVRDKTVAAFQEITRMSI